MAEALGVAASGIAVAQIAIQVGGTVVKLKQLWDEVKDVPDDIADLMDQIDCLDPVLWEVENGFNKSELPSMLWDNLASKSTTRYCRKALENLTAMVEELNLQINTAKRGRRKIVAIKVLLKKDSIKKLERRLENAVRMLTLAQQSYLVALTQVQPDIIVQKFTTLTIHKKQYEPQETSDFASKTEVQTVSPLRHGQQDTGDIYTKPRWVYKTRLTRPNNFGRIYVESFAAGSRVLFQAPVWFSHRSWELHSIKANGAWQLNLRSYRLIPEDSKVIALSRRGSPQDIQRLFDAGLASPYDYTYCGWSLFTYAFFQCNIKVIKYLISIGCFMGDISGWRSATDYSFHYHHTKNYLNFPFATQFISDPSLIKYLLEYDDDENYLLPTCNCKLGHYSVETYKILLPYQCSSHRRTPLWSRLKLAKRVLQTGGDIEVFKLILEPDWTTNRRAISSCPGLPVITDLAYVLVAKLLSCYTSHKELAQIEYPMSSLLDQLTIIVNLLKDTPDIHVSSCIRDLDATALGHAISWVAIAEISSVYSYRAVLHIIYKNVRVWLEALEQAGIDLEAYGRREHEIFVERKYEFYTAYYREMRPIGFKFGPKPEDWEFYFYEPIDDYFSEFWKLIEDPPIRVPGSWVDDDDDN